MPNYAVLCRYGSTKKFWEASNIPLFKRNQYHEKIPENEVRRTLRVFSVIAAPEIAEGVRIILLNRSLYPEEIQHHQLENCLHEAKCLMLAGMKNAQGTSCRLCDYFFLKR